jgi:hypothetical protein
MAWRSGRLPGWLFNGTRARHAASIRKHGFVCSDGAASVRGGGAITATSVVHLGAPEVAAYYMRDVVLHSEQACALVAADADRWLLACGRRPAPLVDVNSIDFPVLPVLGATDADDFRRRLGKSPRWERALTVSGALAFDVPLIPAAYLKVISDPAQLQAFIRQAGATPSGSAFQVAVATAASAQPWMAEGWRFSAHALCGSADLPEDNGLAPGL